MNTQYNLLYTFAKAYAEATGNSFIGISKVDITTIEAVEDWLSECYSNILDYEQQHTAFPFSADNQKYMSKAHNLGFYGILCELAAIGHIKDNVSILGLKDFYVEAKQLSDYAPFGHSQFQQAILDNYECSRFKRILYALLTTLKPLDVSEANSLDYLSDDTDEYDLYPESGYRHIEDMLSERVYEVRSNPDDYNVQFYADELGLPSTASYWDTLNANIQHESLDVLQPEDDVEWSDVSDYDDRDKIFAALDYMIGFEGTYNIASIQQYIEAFIKDDHHD